MTTAVKVWEMVMSFAGYSFCKGHSCSYIRVAQHSCYLRAHYPAEFMAAVLANGGGFYHPFAYVAEAMRMGLTVLPPDVNQSQFRTIGRDRTVRVGFQFIKGLSAEAVQKIEKGKGEGRKEKEEGRKEQEEGGKREFTTFEDFHDRTQLKPEDLRLLVKVGALDSIAGGMTRPMLLWRIDAEREQGTVRNSTGHPGSPSPFSLLPSPASRSPGDPPRLREYATDHRRRMEYELLGFTTDCHPMSLYREALGRVRALPSTELSRHVGRSVVCAGMLTTAKPVHTIQDEPMEFATFDDGAGLIETVLFPDIYRSRGHVLFDQGPFLFRGKVEEEFGAITVTITQIDRLDRVLERARSRSQ